MWGVTPRRPGSSGRAACIVMLFASMFGTGLLNRRWRDPIASLVRNLVIRTFVNARRGSRYERIQDGLTWILPTFAVCLIRSWFALAQTGFTVMIWASGTKDTWLSAFIASGFALNTLGFLRRRDLRVIC